MISTRITCAAVFAALVALVQPASAADHPSVKRAVNLPPSAELSYTITAKHSGLTLGGDARMRWTASARRFDIVVDTKASLLGKLLESHSEGIVNEFGLSPTRLTEKRFRKPQHTVDFNHAAKLIRFSESTTTYPLSGGEQDRTSVTWQLAAITRGAPDKVKAGTVWSFFVAGRREAETWSFKVIGRETVRTPMGNYIAVHIAKLPSQSREEQQLDLWLAPSLEWYPVRMVFKDPNGTVVDQSLRRIDKL